MSYSDNYAKLEDHSRIDSASGFNYDNVQEMVVFLKHYDHCIDTVWLEHMGSQSVEDDLYNAHQSIGRLHGFADDSEFSYSSPMTFVDGFYWLLIEEIDKATSCDDFYISRSLLSDVCDEFTLLFNVSYL